MRRHPHSLSYVLWAVLALISIWFGISQALESASSQDLLTIRRWGVQWLGQGINPYAQPHSDADYPPHAIVLLSLFSMFATPTIVRTWLFVQLLLAPLLGLLVFKAVGPGPLWADALLPVMMLLSWASVRISLWTGQVTTLVLVLGFSGVLLCRKRPVWAGVAFGLALMKPHIGFPFLMWALLAGETLSLLVASTVVGAGIVVFAVRIRSGLAAVISSHWAVLTTLYIDEARYRSADVSAIGFRHLMHALVGPSWLGDTLHVLAMGALLVWLCRVALSARAALAGTFDVALIAMLSLWSLMAFYSQPYNKMLILPGMMWLMIGDDAAVSWRDQAALGMLQVGSVLTFAWAPADEFTYRVTQPVLAGGAPWLGFVLRQGSRLVVLGLLAYLVLRVNRAGILRRAARIEDSLPANVR